MVTLSSVSTCTELDLLYIALHCVILYSYTAKFCGTATVLCTVLYPFLEVILPPLLL